jgi:polyisoprenoid-binding protein YceI
MFLPVIGLLLLFQSAFGQTYTIDRLHTRLGFSATHFGISQVEGNFKEVDATLISTRKDFTDAVISFTAQVASINTDVEFRDNDLKSAAYFDAVIYPELTFKSIAFKRIKGNSYILIGNITIHGISRQVAFSVIYNGTAVTALKQQTVGFTIKGKLNRMDFGVGTNSLISGVSNQIQVSSNIEFTIGK